MNAYSNIVDSVNLLYDDYEALKLIYEKWGLKSLDIVFGNKRADLYIVPFFESGVNFPIALPPDVKFVYPKYKQAKFEN